jgi:hypothetical protein
MLTAFQKFAVMPAKMCQYNGNKSCSNKYIETNKFFLLQTSGQ